MSTGNNGGLQTPPPAADGEYTWANLPTRKPTIEQCRKVIQNWGSSAPRPFAGMPRLSDIGFEDRFVKAYQDICAKLDIIAQDPKGSHAMAVFGAFNVLAAGFADNLVIDNQPFSSFTSPKHVFVGFAALVAGRYRQERETEEGKAGLAEVEKIEARFGKDGIRPTPREVSMCLDHRAELAQKRPPNPVGRDAFGDDGWKPFIKVRDAVIEKTTGKRGGLLDHTNPTHWYEQIETLEKEVEGQGWDLQGPEICRLLWDVLPIHWRKVLKETKSYKSLLVEDFKDTGPQVVTSRYTGLVTAIYENFGHRGMHELGTSLTTEYQQGELETTYAYAERIRSNFAKDLGASWHEWPDQQRTNYARRFVQAGNHSRTRHRSAQLGRIHDDAAAGG